MASFGSAFTGQDDETDKPLTSILSTARNAGSGTYDALFGDPHSRAALLQIGLNLMQPRGIGQTTVGQIGQSIGAGGEAVSRQEAEDLARQKQESEEEYKSRTAGSREREVSAYEKSQELGKADRALQLEQLKQQGRLGLQGAKDYAGRAKRLWEHINSNIMFDPEKADASVKPYIGKQEHEIEAMLRKTDPEAAVGGGGGGPAERQQALDWARANPADPRAKQILDRLGVR